ncbi:MAG: hypothetical protein ABI333_29385 [bacterium]
MLALLLVGTGVWELTAELFQRRNVPARSDWWAAGNAVRREYKKGDLIVTAPGWADPLGRLVLGDLMTLDDVTRPDARTYRRIFELSIRGARHPDVRSWKGARTLGTYGGVVVRLYEQKPVPVATDFYERLDQARVWEESRGRQRPCRWQPERLRFQCGPDWKGVRRIRAEIGYEARRCILALPFDNAARVIEFPALRLGRRIVIWTGLRGYDPRYRARRAVWEYQRWRAGKLRRKRPLRPVAAVPVTLRVSVGSRALARFDHRIEDESWHRRVLALPADLQGRKAAVRFAITTRHGWAKHFCFYARSEGAP